MRDARLPVTTLYRIRSFPRAAILFLVALVLALGSGPAAAQSPHTHQHRFKDADRWARVFDDPARDAWQKPQQVIEALKLAPQARIADLGAGTGYFSVRLASAVPQGRVYAVDVEHDMVRYLSRRAERENLENMVAVAGGPQDPGLPEKVDLVLLVNVYHHIEEREAYFRRLPAYLRPGARVAVIDFTLDSPVGPPRAARIAPERVREELGRAGYRLLETHAFLPYQYFLVFAAPGGHRS